MYKPVIRNLLTTTWKNGLLGNSYKNNNALLFLILNGVQVSSLTSQLCQTRNYRRIIRKDNTSELESLLKNLKDVKTVEAADEITKIITRKDNDAATKKIEELCQDPEIDKLYKKLALEIDWWRQEARQVPNVVEPFAMLQLLQLKNNAKKKYLKYLFLTEKKKEIDSKKKEERTGKLLEWREEKKEKPKGELDIEKIEYNLEKNSLFLRIYGTTINKLYNGNVMSSMIHGNKVIFDCSYDKWMQPKETLSCARQITESLSKNRFHDRPFHVHLCNAHKESKLLLQLQKFIPTLFEDDYPITISEKSYLEEFDKDKLCYLTPHCRTDLTEFDPNTTYIIGAYVDKGTGQPMSLAKAKQDGLRMAKLPLDLYFDWGSGSSKCLTIDCVMKILLDLQVGFDWQKAIKHVPTRKKAETREYVMKHNLRNSGRKRITLSSISLDKSLFDEDSQEEKQEAIKEVQREGKEVTSVNEPEKVKKESAITKKLQKDASSGYETEEKPKSIKTEKDWQLQLQQKILEENMLKRIEAKEMEREKVENSAKASAKKFSYNERIKKQRHWND